MNNMVSENYPKHLASIANKIRESVIAENDNVYQLLAEEANRSSTFMRILFPSEVQRERERLTKERLKTLASKKEELLDLYFRVKLEMARVEGETLIKAAGSHLKTELAVFVTRKIDEMDEAIMQSRERTVAKLKPHIEMIEQYRDFPMLYGPAKDSVNNQILNYMRTLDELLDGFRNSIKSEITLQ